MNKHATDVVTAFAHRRSEPHRKGTVSDAHNRATRSRRDIGPVGTGARLVLGLLLVGLIVSGQLETSGHLSPSTWALGLIGFPTSVLAWHFWRIRRHPRHQLCELRVESCPAPGPVSHRMGRAGSLVYERRGVHLCWQFPAACRAPWLWWMRVSGSLQLAPGALRPDSLCRLYAYRLVGAARCSFIMSSAVESSYREERVCPTFSEKQRPSRV
jgi:hypothetical protein